MSTAPGQAPPASSPSTMPSPQPIPARARFLALLAILALGLALRLWHLETQSLTMDELTELEIARNSLPEIVRTADGFPPLFSLLLRGWLRLLGTEQAARAFSALLGVLALPLMWLLGREVGGERVGLIAAFLLAISPIHVWYSQEVRAYGLCFVVAILTCWRYAVARRTGRRRDWLLYASAAGVGLFVHYYFALAILGLVAIDLLEPAESGRVRKTVARHGPIALAVLAVLPLLIADVRAQAEVAVQHHSFDLVALCYTLFTYLAGFSLGPSLRELHTLPTRQAIHEVLPWAVLLGLAAGYLLISGLRNAERRRTVLGLAVLVGIPVLACGVLSATLGLTYRPRYVAWGAVPVLLLLAIGTVSAGRWAAVALALLVGTSIVAQTNRHTIGRYMNEDARGLAREIERLVQPGAPVFVVSGYMAAPLSHYLREGWSLHPFALAETAPSPDPAVDKITRSVRPGRPFWLVYSRPFDGDPRGRFRDELIAVAGLRLRGTVPGMELYEGVGW